MLELVRKVRGATYASHAPPPRLAEAFPFLWHLRNGREGLCLIVGTMDVGDYKDVEKIITDFVTLYSVLFANKNYFSLGHGGVMLS
ncbi:uncharacterized protein ColSpa_01799 [Colletotrichum spaethianum]|uniref:Uncharacterized protein n=1 Tax=Colletotrichum spaethianum TaxID=700344 RepID=A0AA37NYY4_9PEZI|nr:uncharacterized protein ColSpa_01799 [Colletotrichum spaethianum]GKT41618.1 hypothetical protein ColSpa_01799 [Colletotrichum spaethianum]